ncbi:MAG TPA: metallophosphoesterase family protein [Candidatus Limnocylindrales bacterium]
MRIAVVSDIHSNLVALDAVLAAAGSVDGVWHLGDVVGYGPDPNGVVGRLRDIGAIGVRGNHDAAAVGGSEIEWFNPDARRAMEWTRTVLEPDALAWLSALPERRTEAGIELVHGSPRQPIWEYIVSEASARANLDRLTGTAALHGHTHVPVAWRDAGGDVELIAGHDGDRLSLDDRRVLLNPGSVGQPRDGLPTASFLILEPEATRATWHRTAYDIGAVQAAMRTVGLPRALWRRLEIGA